MFPACSGAECVIDSCVFNWVHEAMLVRVLVVGLMEL